MAWSEEDLEEWRESLSEIADPMFREFVAEERREEEVAGCPVEEWQSELSEALVSAEVGVSAGVPVREDWADPDWSPWAAEEEVEAALSTLDDWQEGTVSAGGSCRQERPVSSEGVSESVAEGGVVSLVSAEEAVSAFGLSSLPGEGVVSAESARGTVVPVAELSEAASSLEVFVEGGRKLREGLSAGSRDAFGDRVDDDGREARGLLRVPHDDGRAYWWFVSLWVREVGVADWRGALEECRQVEGFGIEHDADQVDRHLHLLVRRPRLKSSEKQIRRVLSSLLSCRQESLSVSCVDDMCSAVSYLTHESAPGKHRYRREEVVEKGVELSRWLPEGSTDWVDVVSDMQVVMDSVLARRGRLSFRGFVSWCHAERPDWWRVLVRKASARRYVKDYLKA